jgi:membrane-bound ClpP family serine protease
MDPITLIVLLLALALVLAALETLLPTHGALGVAGLIAAFWAVGVGFSHDTRWGVGLLIGTIVATPLVAMAVLKVWEHSPVGRRLTLTESIRPPAQEPIRVGDSGVTTTALRPMGEAEFGPVIVSVQSRRGLPIDSGTKVRVIGYENGVATVEPA